MARTAGAAADVAITWMAPSAYVGEELMPQLRTGARDRVPPRVVCVVHVAVDRPGRDISRVVRVATSAHVEAPHYADMLRKAGLRLDGRPAGLVRELLDHGVFVAGSAEEVAAGLRRFYAAGADEVVLNVFGVQAVEGPEAALKDLEEIFAALEKTP
jgi:alkanesulfonate monooxygenase SsuD/methylene tetrahydromethanopterin reductase-like flavin-dependent oxidoreductase (luciferase family)